MNSEMCLTDMRFYEYDPTQSDGAGLTRVDVAG